MTMINLECMIIVLISTLILICFNVINAKYNIEYYFFQKNYKKYLIIKSIKTMLLLTLVIYMKYILSKFLIK